ncbi:SIMPL domain-containing protein [Ectobacillus polymachus]|uniref:SIMPL domain-containing protein n=1 Tax=Ectobacillus polymachus TaxID=1508806 RepID=UPI003A8A3E37
MNKVQYIPPYLPPYRETKDTFIQVHGEGMVKAEPDVVIVTLGVITDDISVQTAQERNATTSKSLLSALKQIGIEESDIATLSYTITPLYKVDNTLQGYRVEHLYEITVVNVQKAGGVYAVAMEAGANITHGLTFRVSNPNTFINKALTIAVANALEKASVIANALRVTIHPVPISIKEERGTSFAVYGASQILSAPSIQPGEITITARVIANFTYT